MHLPPIEELFTSVGKVRILNILAIEDELNVTAITTATGLNHSRVVDHLDDLKSKNIVFEKKFGRIKIYLINEKNDAGKRIKKFLKSWYLDSVNGKPEIFNI